MPDYYSGMNSREYWIERLIDRDIFARKSEDELLRKLNKHNREAFLKIRRILNDWYNRYAIDNNITLQEAQRILSPVEFQEYRETMAILRSLYSETNDPYIYEEIARLNTRANITRKMALMDAINVELIKYSHNIQISIEDHLAGVYRREYESALQGFDIPISPVINTEAIKEIINYPYAGAMFSDRVWRNKNQLINWIEDDLTKNLIKGTSVQKMAADLKDRSNTAYHQAERLVRTETNYALNQGHLNSYKKAGVKKYEILAKIDSRTSAICREKNGNIIEIEEGGQVGNNCPPFHPNCRTTIIPVIE